MFRLTVCCYLLLLALGVQAGHEIRSSTGGNPASGIVSFLDELNFEELMDNYKAELNQVFQVAEFSLQSDHPKEVLTGQLDGIQQDLIEAMAYIKERNLAPSEARMTNALFEEYQRKLETLRIMMESLASSSPPSEAKGGSNTEGTPGQAPSSPQDKSSLEFRRAINNYQDQNEKNLKSLQEKIGRERYPFPYSLLELERIKQRNKAMEAELQGKIKGDERRSTIFNTLFASYMAILENARLGLQKNRPKEEIFQKFVLPKRVYSKRKTNAQNPSTTTTPTSSSTGSTMSTDTSGGIPTLPVPPLQQPSLNSPDGSTGKAGEGTFQKGLEGLGRLRIELQELFKAHHNDRSKICAASLALISSYRVQLFEMKAYLEATEEANRERLWNRVVVSYEEISTMLSAFCS